MKSIAGAVLVAAVFCVPALAAEHADAALDAPPQGLKTSTIHVSQVLKLHAQSNGPRAFAEDWQYTDTGASGTEHFERDGDDYYAKVVTGPLTVEYGRHDGKRWRKDANGNTVLDAAADASAFYPIRVREDAEDPKNDVTVAGETSGTPRAYVLRVKLAHAKHPEYVFYDAATGHITRVERVVRNERVVETYDDFRTVDGERQAYHVHDSFADSVFDDDYRLVRFDAGATSLSGHFTAPPSAPSAITVSSGGDIATLPREGYPIVRLTIAGRGYDFMLATTVSGSYIDRAVAAELGLATLGHATTDARGNAIAYTTLLPDADLGPVHFHNYAITATKMAYQYNGSTKIVGFLGYDFFASNVLKLDYPNHRMSVMPSSTFGRSAPSPEAQEIPIEMHDGLLYVPMIIGDGFTKRVEVGINHYATFVWGQYVAAHAQQFQDLATYTRSAAPENYVPFADADTGAFGFKLRLSISRTPTLRFANADYENHAIWTTNAEDPSADALLGLDYLHYFDLYFDYPHQRFIVVPNRWFKAKFNETETHG